MPARIVEITDSDEEELTVDHFHQRPSKFAYLLTLLTSVGGFLIGYDAGVISGGIILLKEDFGMTYVWQSLMVSSTVAAAGIFALIARFFNERFGRKPVILCSSFVFALGSVLTAVASNLTVLLAGRIVVGIAIGRCIRAFSSQRNSCVLRALLTDMKQSGLFGVGSRTKLHNNTSSVECRNWGDVAEVRQSTKRPENAGKILNSSKFAQTFKLIVAVTLVMAAIAVSPEAVAL